MAETFVEVVQIGDVSPHPNADRLEVATVGGYQVVVGKGTFVAGDVAAYFPPNILLPEELAEQLSVTKYLKHAEFNAGEGASQCRAKVEELTYGPTTVGSPRCSFKGREGVVITPLTEQWMNGGRMILKSVSADYLDRKGAEDNE